MGRHASLERNTGETQISLMLDLDGVGNYDGQTGHVFLNHLLQLFAVHGLFDLTLHAKANFLDDHHLVEDVGIILGQGLREALGEKKGIRRYGSIALPMDDVLCLAAVDLSGRSAFRTDYVPAREMVNDLSTEMVPHFFRTLAAHGGVSLHLQFLNPGDNEHHRIEAAFKAFARALRQACELDPRMEDRVPSTKGTL
jgi:imidazoleglycerol-phosphate dehydratase